MFLNRFDEENNINLHVYEHIWILNNNKCMVLDHVVNINNVHSIFCPDNTQHDWQMNSLDRCMWQKQTMIAILQVRINKHEQQISMHSYR